MAPGTLSRGLRSVLVVEDQDDVRLMLVTVLQMEGYRVTDASNALEGLDCLKKRQFDLVLTDYTMPGGTGSWMLQQAAKEGRLSQTPALVITAHPELVQSDPGITVVGKPIDLDGFLQQVARIMHMPAQDHGAGRPARPVPAKVELVLYVSAASSASLVAQSNMERVLSKFNRDEIAYSTCDLQENPETAKDDRIVFTPTLIKRWPVPRLWISGDLRDSDIVGDLLSASGVAFRS